MATTPTITSNTPLIPSRTRSTRIPSQSNSSIVEILNSIQKSVNKIESIVASGYTLQKKQVEQQRRQSLSNTRTKKEKESENVKLVNPFKFLKGALPRTGFLDALKNFILYTFMGLAFTKLYPLLPKVLAIAKGVKPFAKFLENFVGAAFNNFVNAIDLGYKQYDKVRSLAKQIGGEKYEKQFDELSSQLNKFLNLAIIVGLTVAGSGAVGGDGKKLPTRVTPRPGLGGPGGGSTRLSQYFSQTRAQEAVTKKYGFDAARFYQDKINKGLTPANALKAVRERFSTRAIPTGGLAGKGRTAGGIGSRGLGKVQQRAALKLLGKGGTKILGKVPIIGPIADFLISTLVFRERPDRAAAGAVGAAVGAALGSFPALIPFGGPIWGGLLGDIIGRSLFDAVAATPNDKVQKKAKGGPITRGGRSIGGTKRKTPKLPKRFKRNKIQTPQPGKDIGGIKVIRKIYRSPKKLKPGKINPLKTLEDISKIHSKNKDPLFGGIIAATSNLTIGQRPDPSLKQEIRNNFATLIDNAISAQSAKDAAQIGNSIIAAANGGMVQSPVTRTLKAGPTIGEKLGDLIATSFQRSLDMRTNEIFSSIRRKLGLKDDELEGRTPGGAGAGAGNVIVTSDSPDFWMLAVGALLENGDPQGAADVAQVIYNRVASPSWPSTIRDVILQGNGGQFQPVRDYGTIPAWRSITDKNSAIEFLKNYGKGRSQAQLETVAAALLDSAKQNSAKSFIGPRDSFRMISLENEINHLADDTEKRRLGHAFGFEPGGAQIAAFRAGKLSAAQVSSQVKGTVAQTGRGGLPLTGENGRLKPSQLTRVGTLADTPDYNDWYGNGAYLRHDAARQFLKAKADASKQGITLIITSAYRSLEHQRALQGIYPVVAAPGTSQHGEGRALDIRPSTKGWNWFVANGPNYGWYYAAIPGDDVHFEFRGSPTITPTPPAAPGQNPPGQPPATPNQSIKNQGVAFKNGKFMKLGLFGLDQEIEVNNRTNVQLRQIPSFGLGRGTEGQIKKAKDGSYYIFRNGNWVNIHEGGNASIQNNVPSSSIAKFAPSENRQFQQVTNNISKDDPTNMPQQDTIFALQKVYITT